jgi:hypothetical protein
MTYVFINLFIRLIVLRFGTAATIVLFSSIGFVLYFKKKKR